MKILFTCVGRRVELVQAFRSAAQNCDVDLTIYGTDIAETAPAMFYCDEKRIVPRIKNEAYIPTLVDICRTEKIDALIPTIDTDLLLLSQCKDLFEEVETRVMISEPEKIGVCRDKRLTAAYFHSVGLMSPTPCDDVNRYDGGFPAFIKPKDGSSSIFAYKVNHAAELQEFSSRVPDYIIQPFIEGVEYTVDVFCDFDGSPIYITPRVRLEVRAGEVLKTEICQDRKIIEEIQQLLKDYRPCGAITVQLIREKNSGDDYYIEINPRFGGGAPLSMMAGANSAEAMLKLLSGQTMGYVDGAAEHGAVFSRFDQCIRVK